MSENGADQWSGPMRSLAAGCLVLTAWIPLLSVSGMMYPSIVPKALVMRAAVGIGTALLVWGLATNRFRAPDARDPLLWSLVAVTAIFLLSAFVGPSPHHSLFGDFERTWGAIQWVYLTALYILLRTFLDDREWRFFLRVMLYVAVGVAALALLEFAAGRAYPSFAGQGLAGPLGVEGYLGAYMVLSAGLALVVADRATSSARTSGVAVASALLFGTVLVVSGSRAALLGAVLGGAGGMVILLQRAERPGALAARVGGAAALAAVAVWGAWIVSPELLLEIPVIGRIARFDPSIGSFAGRMGAWEAGIEGLAARPLTGWGPENFDLLYSRFVDPEMHRLNPAGMRFDRAHNVLIGKLAQTGPLGFLAYLALWGSIFFTALRAWREDRLGVMEGVGLVAALVGYFVYLQFWFEDHSTAGLLIFLAAYLRHRRSGTPLFAVKRAEGTSGPRSAVWGTACLGIAGLVLWTSGRSALAAARMGEAHAAERLDTKVERFEGARRLGVPEQRSVALEYASDMADLGLQSGVRLRESEKLRPVYSSGVEGADRSLETAAEQRPSDGWIDAQRGRLAAGASLVFAGDGIQKLARESLRRAVEKTPALLDHRHTMANTQALLGNPEAGRRTLREALEMYDGYGRTHYLMSQMNGAPGDSAALTWLRRAFWLDYYPEEKTYLRRTVEALLDRGEPGEAESLLSEYVASRYLPALWERGERGAPLAEERDDFLRDLTAEVEPIGLEDRPHAITRRDMPFLSMWPRAAVAAGDCDRAVLAGRILLNGLSEGQRTASLRPVLARQLARLRERCRDAPRP